MQKTQQISKTQTYAKNPTNFKDPNIGKKPNKITKTQTNFKYRIRMRHIQDAREVRVCEEEM
jgi:hypothetical protein